MPLKQITGTLRNAWGLISNPDLGQLLPPFIVGLLIWMRDTIPRGLGFAERSAHITGVFALAIVMVVSSVGLLTYVAVVYLFIALPIALLRLVPAVERRWPFSAADWPLWTVRKEGFDSGEVA